jgi:hypothetical protein
MRLDAKNSEAKKDRVSFDATPDQFRASATTAQPWRDHRKRHLQSELRKLKR